MSECAQFWVGAEAKGELGGKRRETCKGTALGGVPRGEGRGGEGWRRRSQIRKEPNKWTEVMGWSLGSLFPARAQEEQDFKATGQGTHKESADMQHCHLFWVARFLIPEWVNAHLYRG